MPVTRMESEVLFFEGGGLAITYMTSTELTLLLTDHRTREPGSSASAGAECVA